MKQKVIKRTQLPFKAPIGMSVLTYLLLDNLRLPSWVWGVAFTIIGIYWIGFVYCLFKEEQVEVEWKKSNE
jgi:hypothetical protein